MDQPRTPPGVSGGGQFRKHERSEVHLPTPLNSGSGDDEWDEATYRALASAAAASNSDEIEEFLDHPSPYVRSEAASNLYLTADQAWRLADDPDWCVRWQVSRRLVSGISEKLSNDDDEVIRAQCLADPDLDPDTRERLMSDGDVVVVLERLTGASR